MPDRINLSKMQQERNQWVLENFSGDQMEDSIFGAVEELGELAHHYLKRKQGIRGDAEMHRTEMLDAVADTVIYLAGVCTHLGADYGALVHETWERVKERDWNKHRETGEVPA
jgi:NTP pyrophosphatase (non-canonical NTP hydrolase)